MPTLTSRMPAILIIVLFCITLLPAQPGSAIDKAVQGGIAAGVYPGAVVIAGSSDSIFYHKAFGGFTYEADAPPVKKTSMFGLASLTKVFATTMCVTSLVDKGLLDIEKPVAHYLPAFAAGGKEGILVRNLLEHNGGMPSYYSPKPSQSREEIIEAIFNLEPVYERGDHMVYSCLNFVTLMLVTESITGKPMWQYYKDTFTDPLSMERTMFIPPVELHSEILPVTPSRQGEVHDPLAYGLKGLSGNAGLFSTTGDLAKICQLMLREGEYEGKRYLSEETVALFTKVQEPELSSRALGWDTNLHGSSSAGPVFPSETYGHTGYTGTSVWIDPVHDFFVVFLTNRVYPDDSAVITNSRIKVHSALLKAFLGLPPQPRLNSVLPVGDGIEVRLQSADLHGEVDSTVLFLDAENVPVRLAAYPPGEHMYNYKLDEKSANDMLIFFAVNYTNGRQGIPSDYYAVRGADPDILIVDGAESEHTIQLPINAAPLIHAESIPGEYQYTTVSDDIVRERIVDLQDYDVVIYLCSRENSAATVLDNTEQELLNSYIGNGGSLFISGSEIGFSLDEERSSTADKAFHHSVLGARYLADDSHSYVVEGAGGTLLEGESFSYGTAEALYFVGYPDVLEPTDGSDVLLQYEGGLAAGVINSGDAAHTGTVIYFGFPYETIVGEAHQKNIMKKILSHLKP